MIKPFRHQPIKRKIMLTIVLVSMVTLLLAALSLLLFQWNNARTTIQRTLSVQAEIIAASCTAALTFEDKQAGNEVLAALQSQPHLICACLYRADRQRLAHYGAESDMDQLPAGPLPEGFHAEGSQLILFRTVRFNDRAIGTLYLRFDAQAMEREVILPFAAILAGSTLAAFLAAIFISSLFQRAISAPILQLTSTARAVAERQDYSVRAAAGSQDELGTLTQAFNQMLARIQQQDGALRDSESRYRLLFQLNPMPMFVYAETTNRILAANDAALQHYGYAASELDQMRFDELAAPAAGAPATRHRRRDGSIIEVEITSHCIEFTGWPARLALCLDVTARKQAEQQLITAFDALEAKVSERTQELNQARLTAEAASRAKSRFLAVMSHEIRTPLNGVTGMLRLLLPDRPTPQQGRWIEMARSSADTLLRVINDILDFSKVEAGKLDLHPVPSDLPRVVQNVAATFAHKAADKGLAWTSVIDAAVPTVVELDADRLTQVLGNLLGNALKFTDTGGITLRVTRPAETGDTATVRFAVRDTGPGIAPEHVGQLFKPFSQADNSSTRRHGGTGLGLGICKLLVELMGGRIGVATEVDQGSEFWFEVPFRKTALLPVPILAHPPMAGPNEWRISGPQLQAGAGRVLLAEDNEINRELAREIIRFGGCECDCVGTGQGAVQAVQRGGYDLVFMDCMMPEMDGYEATRAIRAEEARRAAAGLAPRRVPIVAMTANAMTGDRELCLAAGMDDYLVKPLNADEVCQMLSRWQVLRPAGAATANPDTA